MQIFEELNKQQRQAVEAGDGAVLIVAGPGTGKTRTLTARMAYLLAGGIHPNEMVALTFTNKAAREMRDRLTVLVGNSANLPKICTFHALAADLLKHSGDERKLVKPAEQQEIIKSLNRPQALKGLSLRELTLAISRAKTSLGTLLDEAVRRMLETYEATLAEQGVYDFDDLLTKAYQLLQAEKAGRPCYRYVLVDEFQDTSDLQYELLKLLGSGENIFAIGDPNQSIYAFRGAGAEMFTRFRADFPAVKEIALTENYRSCPQIVRLANAIFPDSPQLRPQARAPGNAQSVETLNEYSEAAYVLGEIEQGIGGTTMLSASGHYDVREPRDYAVLYRTHRAGKAVQRAFAEAGIPHQIAGEGSPYEQPEVQAIITELRTTEISSDTPVYDAARKIAERLRLPPDKLAQFFGTLVQFGSDICACLKYLDDIAEQEFYDPSVNAVTLMTVHASKGLEFPRVFLIAAEESILPKITKKDPGDIDEEKRLFYVAVTRGKETLTVLYAKTRAAEPAQPSRFITMLSEKVLPCTADPNLPVLERRQQKRKAKRAQASLF